MNHPMTEQRGWACTSSPADGDAAWWLQGLWRL
jgi:hypothetical protein